jgi:FixJ family two-component response regulator
MARRIRMVRPDLPVLYVTGHIDQVMDVRPLWEGEAFLEKPFSAVGLREAVSLLLDGTLPQSAPEETNAPATVAWSRFTAALTGSLMSTHAILQPVVKTASHAADGCDEHSR